ncbi:DNA polymerase alpha catalytic subunit isoform A [Glycine soja]|nr:DNA polymerase alpha catalytic subunit isoform A [Glycine soja]
MIFADFFKKLQDAVSDVKNEIAQHLVNLEVSNFSMAPVKVSWCKFEVTVDSPKQIIVWRRTERLTRFTIVRKLDGIIFPMGFSKEVTDRNLQAGSNILCAESSERALLNRFMLELHKLDSDVLVGHNISGFDLDVLLHRFQVGILAFPQTISCQFLVNKLIFNNFKNITYIIMQQF